MQVALENVLKDISWARAMTNTFVVHVPSSEKYDEVRLGLVKAAQSYSSNVRLLITPPMAGGAYYGLLPTDMWTAVNSRSQ